MNNINYERTSVTVVQLLSQIATISRLQVLDTTKSSKDYSCLINIVVTSFWKYFYRNNSVRLYAHFVIK